MVKEFMLPGGERIKVRKSIRAKRIILKINHSGEAIVTIPRLVPYYTGLQFAKSQQKWIEAHTATPADTLISPGSRIGKQHRILFQAEATTRAKSYVRQGVVTVTHPKEVHFDHPQVQEEALRAATRAIKKEADAYLPRILHQLAAMYGYRYAQIRVTNMRSRWGSCSSEKVINLSIWLMQLPDDLIEYVCCHELTHLNHPHHQESFWAELAGMIPDWKTRRKKLKEYRPALIVDSE